MSNRENLIAAIVEVELEMFISVKSNEPAPCQQQPDAFRDIRTSIYEFWSEETLESYFKDIIAAQSLGRNLFTEKYARMDNLIPPLNDDPLIGKIFDVEVKWQEEIREKYPALYSHVGRNVDSKESESDFANYLRCELETYSHNTLELYYENLQQALARGENFAETSLERLALKGGYKSLAHAEEVLSQG